jgi:hypothetical protein
MLGLASYVQKKLDRRDFFKLAAVVGIAASLGGRGLAQSPRGEVRPAYVADLRRAQYGRQRGRYPVAQRR